MNENHLSLSRQTIVVQPNDQGARIDKFLSIQIPDFSRSYFARCIDTGSIRINGHIAKSSSLVKAFDTIDIELPASKPIVVSAPYKKELDSIELLFTHEHFLIINKPPQILVHETETPSGQPTVVDWINEHYPSLAHIGMSDRPGIVHRLDKETSGLLIIARTNKAHQIFTDLFKNRLLEKTYTALVNGHPCSKGIINTDIGRDPVHRKKMVATTTQDPLLSSTKPGRNLKPKTTRTAHTGYTVLEYLPHHSIVEVHPKTGRTHQIRVHFSSIGHSLVGDGLYGTRSLAIERHALHASSLRFEFLGEKFHFTAEIPADFKKAIEILKKSY